MCACVSVEVHLEQRAGGHCSRVDSVVCSSWRRCSALLKWSTTSVLVNSFFACQDNDNPTAPCRSRHRVRMVIFCNHISCQISSFETREIVRPLVKFYRCFINTHQILYLWCAPHSIIIYLWCAPHSIIISELFYSFMLHNMVSLLTAGSRLCSVVVWNWPRVFDIYAPSY